METCPQLTPYSADGMHGEEKSSREQAGDAPSDSVPPISKPQNPIKYFPLKVSMRLKSRWSQTGLHRIKGAHHSRHGVPWSTLDPVQHLTAPAQNPL